jgi:folate-binding protein YgfZ
MSEIYMLINLPNQGFLQVKGDGAKALLQGQLTCNLDEITVTQTRLGAHCNPQGRILSLFRLWYFQEAYYLQMPDDLLPIAMTALKKYAGFYKVTLTEAALASAVYQGDQLISPTDDTLILPLPGESVHAILGEPAAVQRIVSTLDKGAISDNLNDWKKLQIENGIPTIYANTSGKLLPQELNLDQLGAVSFNKGCYTGQEIIARMHYRGQAKKRLFRARVNTPTTPQPGDDIFMDNACGTIVDSYPENATTQQLLVVANCSDVASQTLFLDPGKTQPLEFLTLPSGSQHV